MNTNPQTPGEFQQAISSLNNRIIVAIIIGAFTIGGAATGAGVKYAKLCHDVKMNKRYVEWLHSQTDIGPVPPEVWDQP